MLYSTRRTIAMSPVLVSRLLLQNILLLCLVAALRCDAFAPALPHLSRFTFPTSRRSTLVTRLYESTSDYATLSPSERRSLARSLVRNGMSAFRLGQVQQSLDVFDQADALFPDGSYHPFLWQRGLTLYYLDKFEEASMQFRDDVKVNPLDVEEIVWYIAAQKRYKASSEVTYMALPSGRQDPRRIMPVVYKLFRNEGSEEDLAMAGHTSKSNSDLFYALLYLTLFAESNNETSKAEAYWRDCISTNYYKANTSSTAGDYMTFVAKVHGQLRRWS